MGIARSSLLLASLLALALLATALPTVASVHRDTFLLEDVYTEETTTTNRDVLLKGDTVLEAWFNFTLTDDIINSDPDSFLFTVTNLDDAELRQSLPGTTDTQGRLFVSMPVTLEGSPRWTASVSCTVAGDTMLGPIVIEADGGNAWDLQVEYVYEIEDDSGNGNGNGGDGGDGGGGDDEPALVTVMEANLILVSLLSILVAFLSIGPLMEGGGPMKMPLVLAGILALDAFVFLPVALVVNQELNGAVIAMPPYGAQWLGNLALILLVIWVVPFIVAKKRVLGSDEVHSFLSRVTAQKLADKVRGRAERFPDDSLSDRMLALLMVVLGVASVAVVALMLLT
jgi:hypothetical protein